MGEQGLWAPIEGTRRQAEEHTGSGRAERPGLLVVRMRAVSESGESGTVVGSNQLKDNSVARDGGALRRSWCEGVEFALLTEREVPVTPTLSSHRQG